MMRKVYLAVLGVPLRLMAGCMQDKDAQLIDDAKASVRASLIDPASATFEGLRVVSVVKDEHDRRIVCGLVNAKNRLGGYGGRRLFMYNGYSAAIYDDNDWLRYAEEMLACDPTLVNRQ
jgi:hypothetical protein